MRPLRRCWPGMAFAVVAVGALVACGDDEPNGTTTGGGAGGGMGGVAGIGGAGGTGGMAGAGGDDPCPPSLPVDAAVPETLSETGLYADIGSKTVAAYARSFTPQFELWSDGADKQRWLYLPECTSIDTSNPDDWSLPVGARLWKEFSVGGQRIETRLIERIGPGPHDFVYAAYLWDAGETEAQRMPDGATDAKGTSHDVPSESDCRRCHGSHENGGGRPSRALGVSAIQLDHDGAGVTLAGLAAERRLSDPPPAITLPGDAVARAALGIVHANCGHCHNDTVDRIKQVDLSLWLRVGDTSVETTAAYLTAVGQPNTLFNDQNVTARIVPGDPAQSSVWFRMSARGNNAQMPPLASEVIDATGIAAVETWIQSL